MELNNCGRVARPCYGLIYIITGHYGSGKTNIAVSLALENKNKTTVVDLDIVNYYFRTADFKELFAENSIDLLSAMYANTNIDIPVLGFSLDGIEGDIILDVGGDDAGATALGVYTDYLKTQEYQMYYVINKYRYMTANPEDTLELMREIEKVSNLKHTAIINNSNLGEETTAEIIDSALGYADEVARLANLPLLFTAIPDYIHSEKYKPIKIYVKKPWEDDNGKN